MGKMQDRHERILDLLTARPVCTVVELSETLGVTAETIRKDLDALERQGKATRIHGGAALTERQGALVPYSARAQRHSDEKRRVANAAAALVAEGDVLLLEASTTTMHLCHALAQDLERLKTLTIFSNSIMVAQAMQMGRLCDRFFLLGGWLRRTEGAAYGSFTVAQLEAMRVSKAFLSGAALDDHLNLTAYHEADLGFQRCAMDCAEKSVLMLDSGKYPTHGIYHVCAAEAFDYFVTDAALSAQNAQKLAAGGCRLMRA